MESDTLEKIANKHLLAIIQPEDEKNYGLVRAFLSSLPGETEIKFSSKGFLNGAPRDYLLLAAPDFSGMNTQYFAERLGSAVFEITGLSVDIDFTRKYNCTLGEVTSGCVDNMLDCYKRLSEMSPEPLFTQELFLLIDRQARDEAAGLPKKAQTARQMKETFFKDACWCRDTKLAAPTNISVSLKYVPLCPKEVIYLGNEIILEKKDLGTYKGALNNLKREE